MHELEESMLRIPGRRVEVAHRQRIHG
jgi:hypothetical protein